MRIADVPTPGLILDRRVLDINLARMRARARVLGVTLRPHLKTAKSVQVARLANNPARGGICVSTLDEAEYFAAAEFDDITYAVGVTPDKLDRIQRIENTGARMTVLVDSPRIIAAVLDRAEELGLRLRVLIEVDSGAGRGGSAPESATLLEVGRLVTASPAATLEGVLTHAGHSYAARNKIELSAIAEAERAAVVTAAARLNAAGINCAVVSVGSTPTALFADHLSGVTELRCGVYMFMDCYQLGLGCCGEQDLAVSVIAGLIGERENDGQLLVDAGALALSQDASTESIFGDTGYGRLRDETTGGLLAGGRVSRVYQEHGVITLSPDSAAFSLIRQAGRARIYPNHVCMTVAPYDQYHVTEDGTTICDVWGKTHGW